MAAEHLNHTEYDLKLPPRAPHLPGDEPSVELLANPEIRTGLGKVNTLISEYYQQLSETGKVHELFRGATHDGLGIAVAEYTDAQTADPSAEELQANTPIFRENGRYTVFAFRLDKLLTEDVHLATTPRQLVGMPQSRDGTYTVGVEIGGISELKVPLSWREKPTVDGNEVVSFRDAAFGERRTAEAASSLSWIAAQAYKASRAARRASGDEARALEERVRKISDYYNSRLHDLYQHPERIDEPEDIWEGVDDERIQALASAKGTNPDYLRAVVRDIVKNAHTNDPNELEVIRAVVAPAEPDRRGTAWDSFYRRGGTRRRKRHRWQDT